MTDMWKAWKNEYNKKYPNADEEVYRFTVWEENVLTVNKCKVHPKWTKNQLEVFFRWGCTTWPTI